MTAKPVVGIVGTSIADGTGATGGESYPVLACKSARLPFVILGKGGESMAILNTSANHAVRFGLLDAMCTDVIVEHGVNDGISGGAASFTTYKSRYRTLWASLRALGLRVWQNTLPPSYNTSSDAWLTTASQGPSTGDAVRLQVNAWLRAGAKDDTNTTPNPDLTGVFEIADLLETARDSGIWKADGTTGGKYTADGVHPSGLGHTQAAAGINTAAIQAAFDATQGPAPVALKTILRLGGTPVAFR